MRSMHHMMDHQTNQPQRSIISPSVKVTPPDCYSGERSVLVIDGWIRTVERYFAFVGLEAHRKVPYAVTLLRSKADLWWRQMEQLSEDDSITEWDDFKTRLVDNFKPRNARKIARDSLYHLQQGSSTVQEYTEKFHDIIMEIDGITDDEKLDRYVRGLHPAIQTHVNTNLPEFLVHAEQYAMAYGNAHQNATQPHPLGPTPMDLDAISHRQPRPNTHHRTNRRRSPHRSSSHQSRPTTDDFRCYNCGGTGHLSRQCPSPRPDRPDSSSKKAPARLP